MSKLGKVKESPDYGRSSRVEDVIGFLIIFAIALAVVFAAAGEVFGGVMLFAGAIGAWLSVLAARNAR